MALQPPESDDVSDKTRLSILAKVYETLEEARKKPAPGTYEYAGTGRRSLRPGKRMHF
ncbi:hypothetical protein [Megasphaera massiliensis]|uniref:hypothetical protein n=1 Tax=Megasphaera massiliensis TaxID=1232428 RepID=UPI000416A1E5|nr:hypothetical protein [uncultured Megasphaera sp.]